MSQEKSPKWLRIVEIVLGAIAIGLASAVLANPGEAAYFIATLLGIALVMVGISKIIEGAVSRHISKGSRFINIGIGIVAIAGGFYAMSNPEIVIGTLMFIISFFILIHGVGLISTGAASRGEGKASRISNLVIGIIVVIFAVILLAKPEFLAFLFIFFLSFGLLLNGIASIISGITGNRRISPITK